MSSPVFAITVSESPPTTSSIPRASFAPPVPPARTTTWVVTASPGSRCAPRPGWSMRAQARDLDSGPDLVAHVDRDDQRGELLDDPGHLERAAVDRPQPWDRLYELGERHLVLAAVAAHEDVLVEVVVEVRQERCADGVERGHHVHAVGRHLLRLLRR